MSPARDPETPDEWQAAVDCADFLLRLDSARQYGLIEGGPVIDVARCVGILSRGAAQGYRCASDSPDNALQRVGGGDR